MDGLITCVSEGDESEVGRIDGLIIGSSEVGRIDGLIIGSSEVGMVVGDEIGASVGAKVGTSAYSQLQVMEESTSSNVLYHAPPASYTK